MKGIKIRVSDKWFSLCIRERADWRCERCSTFYPEGKRMALHCSHFHGRAKWGTRFDPFNCEALCYGCHSYLGGQPDIHQQEKITRIGNEEYNRLLIRANSPKLGRDAKRQEGFIKDHYRKQHKTMEQKRKDGHTGRLEFEPCEFFIPNLR